MRSLTLCWRCRLEGKGIDARRSGRVGEVAQRRLNARYAADAAGERGEVWSVGMDEMGGKLLASDG